MIKWKDDIAEVEQDDVNRFSIHCQTLLVINITPEIKFQSTITPPNPLLF
jgi:hypothetical protein